MTAAIVEDMLAKACQLAFACTLKRMRYLKLGENVLVVDPHYIVTREFMNRTVLNRC